MSVERKKSTWDQVVRHEVRDLTKREAVTQIRRLARDKSLSEKKADLNTAQQSQPRESAGRSPTT